MVKLKLLLLLLLKKNNFQELFETEPLTSEQSSQLGKNQHDIDRQWTNHQVTRIIIIMITGKDHDEHWEAYEDKIEDDDHDDHDDCDDDVIVNEGGFFKSFPIQRDSRCVREKIQMAYERVDRCLGIHILTKMMQNSRTFPIKRLGDKPL